MTRVRFGIALSLLVGAGGPAAAQVPPAEMPAPDISPPPAPPPIDPDPVPVVPSHLSIGSQQFDASVGGLRAYLESIKSKELRLYTALEPDLERLEQKRTTAAIVFATGVGLGLVSGIYAIAGRKDCPAPSVTDPNFAADSAAWGACNDDNQHKTGTFALIGLGAIAAGAIGWVALAPGRSDLFDFVNEHNRLNAEPLRLQLGYDPTRRFAFGGATLSF